MSPLFLFSIKGSQFAGVLADNNSGFPTLNNAEGFHPIRDATARHVIGVAIKKDSRMRISIQIPTVP